jgi:trigger factor
MKVTEKKRDKKAVVLEARASIEDVERAFEAAQMSFAQQMGFKAEGSKTIAEIAHDTFNIKDFDETVRLQVIDYLTPFAVDKKNLIPAYPAKIVSQEKAQRGLELSFTLEVPLKVGLKLSSYEPVSIKMPPFQISDSQIDSQITQMAESYAEFAEIEQRPARMSDSCLVNITAQKDGRDLPELTAEKAIYNLGSNQLGENFDTQIIGMNAGDTKTFPLEMAGLAPSAEESIVECTVDLIEVRERVIPLIDDAWIKLNVPEAETLEKFRSLIHKEFSKSYAEDYQAMLRQRALEELAKRYEGPVDDEAILAMQKNIINNLNIQLRQEDMSFEEYVEKNGGEQQFNLATMMQSKENLVQGYTLDALFSHEKFILTDEDILEACKTIDKENPSLIRKQMEYSGCGYMLKETAERLKASNWIVEHANIIVEEERAEESS